MGLGERLNGIQEVSGSIPLISTISRESAFSSPRLRRGFVLCGDSVKVDPEAELLKVDVKVDMQLVVPIDLDPLDKAVDDHFLCLDAGRIIYIGP